MVAHAPWSGEEIEILNTLAEKDCIIDDACRVLKSRTKAAIIKKCFDMNIDLPTARIEIDHAELESILKLRKV